MFWNKWKNSGIAGNTCWKNWNTFWNTWKTSVKLGDASWKRWNMFRTRGKPLEMLELPVGKMVYVLG